MMTVLNSCTYKLNFDRCMDISSLSWKMCGLCTVSFTVVVVVVVVVVI
jgi:hypothetical protein